MEIVLELVLAFVWVGGFFAARGYYALKHENGRGKGRFKEGWLMFTWPFKIWVELISEEWGRGRNER